MFLASIDVGIVNLAVVFAELHDVTFEITRFLQLENVNTTIMSHTTVTRQNCTLGHAKTTADRISHFVQERQTLFDACHVILIERQPLVGLTDVEQVLFLLFRTKAQLVSPNAMHCFFNINGFNYQGRKQQTTMIVDHYLDPHVFPEYFLMERRHDIADAICLLFYWITTQRTPKPAPKPQPASKPQPAPIAFQSLRQSLRQSDNVVEEFKKNISRFQFQKKN